MKKFKTESKRLLNLMINSIYTNREIFLRELISNASDALDKLYIASLTNRNVKVSRDELGIGLAFDAEARTITVSDNGIGMSRDSLDKNLGTIAHSGSLEFKVEQEEADKGSKAAEPAEDTEKADESAQDTPENSAEPGGEAEAATEAKATDERKGEAIDLIGQFGVGFYSGFMVASEVRVISRAYEEEQAWMWKSNGIDGYDLKEASRPEHGTDVILTLKPDSDEEDFSLFLSEAELSYLVKKYSNYVRYPIRMEVTRRRELPKPADAGEDYTPEYESYQETETLNSMTPIWKRRKSEVSEEEYAEFYKSDFHDHAAPVATFTINAEGALNYDALLFIPSHAPFDLYSKDFEKGLALYSSNVMIMEKCPDLLPDHFNFVRGVVDSADLDLNISRETLQKNNQLRAMARRIEKKIISELSTLMAKDRETYEGVFECFGRSMKYGIYTSYGALKDTLAPLLLYYSAKEEKMVSLQEYLDAAPSEQEAVYYAAGEDEALLARMPMVKSVLARGFDVLLCVQDVDDFCLGVMGSYEEKPFKNVAGADLGLESEEEKQETEKKSQEYQELFKAMQELLDTKVSKVRLSTRLADMPAGISAEGPVSLEMERVLAAMPDGGGIKSERVLELNAEHPAFAKLVEAREGGDDGRLALLTNILYNQALLVEGLPVTDPVDFAQAIGQLLI
ncbi:MAG: molecular chaperone HtpG [Coriobacteriales bacterium]|jgi:molecular chaperone HtpG|nr:molecular chaperone HtpG [Coriobacteriales bacterium]